MIQTLTGSNELDAFYKDKFYFSYSSISKLLFSPAAFYNHYVLKQREDVVAPHLVSGRVLHCLLFEPEKYDDNFISMPGKIPTDSQRKIIDNIFRKYLDINNNALSLVDFSDDILTELLTANLYQSLKTDLQRTEKILTEENKNYFTFLIDSQDKTIVDEPTLNNCKSGVEALKSNEEVRSLLQLDKSEEDVHIESYSELPIEANVEHLPFGFKGILDNVVIDKESKTIFINDLKTTGKPLVDFPESVQYYKYWVQAMVYVKLTYDKFLKDLPDLNEWNLYFTFIVIDKYNQVYPFQVSMETMTIWQQDFEELTDILKYHYEKKEFKLPYELAKGNVKL
jgi:PD-(D/E)XK nuclease superfamily